MLLSPPANMNNHTNLHWSEAEPQIRRITMKKSQEAAGKKKDSIASLVVDTKDSLKAPLIIETLDIEEDMVEDDTMEEGMDEKMRAKFLSKGDLPRSMRSTRRLSAFNEQLYEQQQLFLQQPKKPYNPRSRSRSSLSSSEVKAASCDAIAASQQKSAQNKGHKSIQVIPASTSCARRAAAAAMALQTNARILLSFKWIFILFELNSWIFAQKRGLLWILT